VSKRTITNLVFFVGIFLLMCFWAVNNIITIDQIDEPYTIHGEFTAAAGVMTNAEVAYLGVHYGTVGAVERIPGGVRMTMKVDKGKQIPLHSIARIYRKSAIGEPYIDFKPPDGYKGDAGPFIQPGNTVPVSETTTPLEFSELLRSASALLSHIDPAKAGSLIHELSVALNGRADDLRSLTTSFDQLNATFAAKTDVLDRLSTNNTAITKVIADHANDLGQSITNLRLLADSLAAANGDTATVLDRGSQLVGQLAELVADSKGNLDCTLKALTGVIDLTASKVDGLEAVLRDGPRAFNELVATTDNGPDGIWARVNLLVDPTSPPGQYDPPLPLPAHRVVGACTSSLPSSGGASFVPADVLADSTTTSNTLLPATGGTTLLGLAGALVVAAVIFRRVTPRVRHR
jgi:phospholipid/cholesterol/gamma-HCH transport system substrate-binding protein